MLKGAGRHKLRGDRFGTRTDLGPPGQVAAVAARSVHKETADIGESGTPLNTSSRMFAKPSGVGLSTGLISNDPREVVTMARDMYDNDEISGAVVDTLAGIPFGNFGLSGMPDKSYLEPYDKSLDRVRIKTLLPVLATTFLVDGAFLGTGVFDSKTNLYDAIIPQDVLHAEITPVPYFGATPIVDLLVPPESIRHLRSSDERMQRYVKFLPEEFLRGGRIKLQPENTFYLPRRTQAHMPLGVSLYRKIMVTYILEKALKRGTIEMAYRRQRPVLHVVAGDENWDVSQEEMQILSDLFSAADLDPLGAIVVTRPGVQPSELAGGANDAWRWTDVADTLNSIKLKGLGMPDGLLGGDMALDSVSATLTVFINMVRQFRDYITRILFYEKMFPYLSVTNGHRRDSLGAFQATGGRSTSRFMNHHVFMANDLDDVDVGDYLTPAVSWHNSMRPEGDKEYLDLLMTLTQQCGVPIPLRMLAAAGGLDIHDVLNSAEDDMEIREKSAKYTAMVQAMSDAQQQGGGDQGGGDQQYDEQSSLRSVHDRLSPIQRKTLLTRKFDDRMAPRNPRNGPYARPTTARETARLEEKANRTIATAMSSVAKKCNALLMHNQLVDPNRDVGTVQDIAATGKRRSTVGWVGDHF